jgi:hypothetical protein
MNRESTKKRTKTFMYYFETFQAFVWIIDGQMAAREADPARGLIYSGPRQVAGLVRLVKVSISA